MLTVVGHEVLRPLQPANARSRARPSEVSRPSGPSTGPLARQPADPTKAATGCDLRVMSKANPVSNGLIRLLGHHSPRSPRPQRLIRYWRCRSVPLRLGHGSGHGVPANDIGALPANLLHATATQPHAHVQSESQDCMRLKNRRSAVRRRPLSSVASRRLGSNSRRRSTDAVQLSEVTSWSGA
jgi:hypothetical protein